MRRTTTALAAVLLTAACSTGGSDSTATTAAPSATGRATSTGTANTSEVVAAADAFLATLSAEQRETAVYEFDDEVKKSGGRTSRPRSWSATGCRSPTSTTGRTPRRSRSWRPRSATRATGGSRRSAPRTATSWRTRSPAAATRAARRVGGHRAAGRGRAAPAAAHPLDEVAQQVYLTPARSGLAVELRLWPGVLVALQFVRMIDTDGDGALGPAEVDAHVAAVQAAVTVEIDGRPAELTPADRRYATPDLLTAGAGTVVVRWTADLPADARAVVLTDATSRRLRDARTAGYGHGVRTRPAGLRATATLGLSAGMVPCPEALSVLLLAIGLNRVGLGLTMIVAFSVGLAAVLVGLGLLLVTSAPVLSRLPGTRSTWVTTRLPLVSSVVVAILGGAMTVTGLSALTV